MASLQAIRVKGKTYYRLVTCRRVNGKPTPVVLAYLGKADDILTRLEGADEARVRSWSHGAVAALYALARELRLAEIIDRHLCASGRRVRPSSQVAGPVPPQSNDGLTVGQSLVLVAIGRACYATSKRALAAWAKTTTLGQLAGVDVERLTSQHFWDQMDQLPVELIEPIERDLVADVVQRFQLPLDTLLFDATNFFTFIASANDRCELPALRRSREGDRRCSPEGDPSGNMIGTSIGDERALLHGAEGERARRTYERGRRVYQDPVGSSAGAVSRRAARRFPYGVVGRPPAGGQGTDTEQHSCQPPTNRALFCS